MLQGITSTNLARVILYYLSLVALNFRNNTEFIAQKSPKSLVGITSLPSSYVVHTKRLPLSTQKCISAKYQ